MTRSFFYRVLIAAACRVPAGLGYFVASVIADVASVTARRSRGILDANLRVVVDEVTPRMRRSAFRNLVWNYLEMFRMPVTSVETLPPDITEPIEQVLRQVTDDGRRGAVIVFCHVGNVELFSQLASGLPGMRFAVVVEHMRNERVFQLLRDLRRSNGVEVVQADEPRRLVELLVAGCSIVIAADLDSTGQGVFVEYFGRPALMPTGAVKLAMRTGSPLVMASSWRTDVDRSPQCFEARIDGPIDMPGSTRDPHAVTANLRRLVDHVEAVVREHPEQWLAFHSIWESSG